MPASIIKLLLATRALSCIATAADPVAVEDIKFSFTKPAVAPDRDVPKDARNAKGTPDSGNPGPLSDVVAGRIAALTVTWSNPALFGTAKDAADFLRRLLDSRKGSTYPHIPWAQNLGVPDVAATVQHSDGKNGRWLVWYAWPSVYSAYQDGTGRWWFSAWFHDKDVRLETQKPGLQ